MIKSLNFYSSRCVWCILVLLNCKVLANYDIDYKIILDIDNINSNYQLSPDVNDVYNVSRTRITILDLNIILSYYQNFSKSKEKGYKKTGSFILKDILKDKDPLLKLKEYLDLYEFMFYVTDIRTDTQKISDQYIEVEFAYTLPGWNYFYKTKQSSDDVSVWEIGLSMNKYYEQTYNKNHSLYESLYENKKSNFSSLVNIITLAINNNSSLGSNKVSQTIFNESYIIPENYNNLKLLIPIKHH